MGFSVLCIEQVGFALQLARELRNRLETTIIFGGSELSGWPNHLLERLVKLPQVDFVVLGDGEYAMESILAGELSYDAPRILRGGHVPLSAVDVDASFLIRPEPYVKPWCYNVAESKGCYWNKCTHCDYIALNDKLDFGRDLDILVSKISVFSDQSGVSKFHLVNDTLAPARARRLATIVREKAPGIRWNCFVKIDHRFSEELLATLPEGGCEYIVVGVESLSDGPLSTLQKGYTAQEAIDWIRIALHHKVGLIINLIVGIPGSTNEDDEETLNRLAQFPALGGRVKVFRFVLARNTVIGRNPERYGLLPVNNGLMPAAHRGGSSMQLPTDHDLDERETRFRAGIAELNARKRMLGGLASWFLRAELGSDLESLPLVVSPLIEAVETQDDKQSVTHIYDHLSNASFTIDGEFAAIIETMRTSHVIDATDFVRTYCRENRVAQDDAISLLWNLIACGALRRQQSLRSGEHAHTCI